MLYAKLYPYAMVVNGEWYEQGEMGWWGFNNSTQDSINAFEQKYDEVINNPKYQDYYIAFVDCHI